MPIFRFNTYFGVGRGVKAFLNLDGGITRDPLPDAKNRKKSGAKNQNKVRDEGQNNDVQERTSEHARKCLGKIEVKRQDFRKARTEEHAAKSKAQVFAHKRKKKMIGQEIFRLERELRAAEEGWAEDEPVTGALPDFLVIGVGKGGTTFLYHLLSQHPHVQPAATKELHFFDAFFD